MGDVQGFEGLPCLFHWSMSSLILLQYENMGKLKCLQFNISCIYFPNFFCSLFFIQSFSFSKLGLHIRKVSNSTFSVSSREQSSNAVKFKAEIPNQASGSATEVHDSFISGCAIEIQVTPLSWFLKTKQIE